jgi:hypothetical protein
MGRESKEEDVSSSSMTLRKMKIIEFERGSTKSKSLKISLWKGMWTFPKTGYAMNESYSENTYNLPSFLKVRHYV